MFPDLFLQHHGTDIVTGALVLIRPMGGAGKEVLPLFKIACGGVVQLLLAIVTEHKSGEHIALTRCRSAMPLLSDFLYRVKHLQRDNRRMGILKNLAVFLWIVPLLLVPNGVGVGLEVDRAAGVLLVFENVGNCAFVPSVFVLRCLMRGLAPLSMFVCGGVEALLLFKLCGDLTRPLALHAESKNFFDDSCRFFIHNPLLRVIGLFVPIGNVGCQSLATLTLCLVDRTDFVAGVSRIKLVEPVLDACKIIVDAVWGNGVVIVIDGNEADTMLGKSEVDEHTPP